MWTWPKGLINTFQLPHRLQVGGISFFWRDPPNKKELPTDLLPVPFSYFTEMQKFSAHKWCCHFLLFPHLNSWELRKMLFSAFLFYPRERAIWHCHDPSSSDILVHESVNLLLTWKCLWDCSHSLGMREWQDKWEYISYPDVTIHGVVYLYLDWVEADIVWHVEIYRIVHCGICAHNFGSVFADIIRFSTF